MIREQTYFPTHEHMALVRSRPLIKPLFDEMQRSRLEYLDEQAPGEAVT